jgi:hypothetical protein
MLCSCVCVCVCVCARQPSLLVGEGPWEAELKTPVGDIKIVSVANTKHTLGNALHFIFPLTSWEVDLLLLHLK